MNWMAGFTLLWGMEGLLGTLLWLGIGLYCIFGGIECVSQAAAGKRPGKLTVDRRGALLGAGGALLIAMGVWGVGAGVLSIPNIFRVQTVVLTVATLEDEILSDGSAEYHVKDTSGRKFDAQSDLWADLVEGVRATCRATDPLFGFTPVLLNCARQQR